MNGAGQRICCSQQAAHHLRGEQYMNYPLKNFLIDNFLTHVHIRA